MTFEERVTALAPLGFTPRQTRFLVTAALHSGYCLRRQYLAFAGVRLRQERAATSWRRWCTAARATLPVSAEPGHVYHLHAKALYRALGSATTAIADR